MIRLSEERQPQSVPVEQDLADGLLDPDDYSCEGCSLLLLNQFSRKSRTLKLIKELVTRYDIVSFISKIITWDCGIFYHDW